MHLSGCRASIGNRRSVDFKRRCSSSGEEEGAAKDKSSEQDSDRGSHAAPSFPRSRKLQPGQDRRPLQRFYMEGSCALPRIARETTANPSVTTRATPECP